MDSWLKQRLVNPEEAEKTRPFAPDKDIHYATGYGIDQADAKRGYVIPDVPKPSGRWADSNRITRISLDAGDNPIADYVY